MPHWLWVAGAVVVAAVGFHYTDTATVGALGWVSLCSAAIFFFYLAGSGRDVRNCRGSLSSEREALIVHHAHVAILATFVLVGVVGVETVVQRLGGLWGDPRFVSFHLVLVGCAVVAFLMALLYMTGLRNAKLHRVIVYVFAVCYLGAFVTGSILLNEQFPRQHGATERR